jgi:hypothetical protein
MVFPESHLLRKVAYSYFFTPPWTLLSERMWWRKARTVFGSKDRVIALLERRELGSLATSCCDIPALSPPSNFPRERERERERVRGERETEREWRERGECLSYLNHNFFCYMQSYPILIEIEAYVFRDLWVYPNKNLWNRKIYGKQRV